MSKEFVDPAYEAWNKKYPKFPGLEKCVEILFRHNTVGSLVDTICWEVEKYSREHLEELIKIIRDPDHIGYMRSSLLHILIDIASPRSIPCFKEIIESDRDDLHIYAVRGLEKINTKDARKILWRYNKSKE
jgi:hypothetical protein